MPIKWTWQWKPSEDGQNVHKMFPRNSFYVFFASLVIGWSLLLFWNLNHEYCWITDGTLSDRFYGSGVAIMFLGCAHHINSARRYGWEKALTEFFFFTTISSLCDEVFFNPLIVSVWEWLLAATVWIFLLYKNRDK